MPYLNNPIILPELHVSLDLNLTELKFHWNNTIYQNEITLVYGFMAKTYLKRVLKYNKFSKVSVLELML